MQYAQNFTDMEEIQVIRQGLLQAKFEVGHRVWGSRVWYTKLPNSKKMDLIKINKKKAKEKTRNKAKQIYIQKRENQLVENSTFTATRET